MAQEGQEKRGSWQCLRNVTGRACACVFVHVHVRARVCVCACADLRMPVAQPWGAAVVFAASAFIAKCFHRSSLYYVLPRSSAFTKGTRVYGSNISHSVRDKISG